MELNTTVIGYILYVGLGLSVLSFLMLVLAMLVKKESEPIFDQAMNGEYEDEDDDEDVYEDEEEDYGNEKVKKKSLFGFGKKREKTMNHDEFEIFEEDEEGEKYMDEDEEENEKQDEYAKDFEFSFREEEAEVTRKRTPFDKMELSRFDYEIDEEDETFKEIEIKKYLNEETETPYNRIDDSAVDEEDEMLKRIQKYKDKFKK